MTDSSAMQAATAWDRFQRWFLRGRIFRTATQSRMLALGTVGVLLTVFGWWTLAKVFSGSSDPALQTLLESYESCPWKNYVNAPLYALATRGFDGPNLGDRPSDAMLTPWHRLSTPFVQLFDVSRSFVGATFLLLCGIWAAAVWGFFGGAMTRIAVVQLAREETTSLGAAVGYTLPRLRTYIAAPLFPIAFVVGLSVPALFLGLVMKLSVFVVGVLWPLALLIGLTASIVLAGLSIGWPLMNVAVSAEGSDSFDALSRSYSYVYQRPLHYLLYATSAVVLGLFGLAVVEFFAGAVETLAFWSISWGSGSELAVATMKAANSPQAPAALGEKLFWFWHGLIDAGVLGFAFAFFWSASSAIYLLLRFEADGADLDELYIVEIPEPIGGTTLPADPAGAPAPTDG